MLGGIIPKMAIRFTSYEAYKDMLAGKDGQVTSKATFLGMFTLCKDTIAHYLQPSFPISFTNRDVEQPVSQLV